jgi:hypothetical protein
MMVTSAGAWPPTLGIRDPVTTTSAAAVSLSEGFSGSSWACGVVVSERDNSAKQLATRSFLFFNLQSF